MAWFADHRYPLWLVDRAKFGWERYFTADNLQTLCDDCHKHKTAREAGQRAKVKRLRRETGAGPKRKIPSRGFPKGKRTLPSRALRTH